MEGPSLPVQLPDHDCFSQSPATYSKCQKFVYFDISSNSPCWSFLGSNATAESQKNEILRGAQNDNYALIQAAIILGNSYIFSEPCVSWMQP